jgi:hypothetical protein
MQRLPPQEQTLRDIAQEAVSRTVSDAEQAVLLNAETDIMGVALGRKAVEKLASQSEVLEKVQAVRLRKVDGVKAHGHHRKVAVRLQLQFQATRLGEVQGSLQE